MYRSYSEDNLLDNQNDQIKVKNNHSQTNTKKKGSNYLTNLLNEH